MLVTDSAGKQESTCKHLSAIAPISSSGLSPWVAMPPVMVDSTKREAEVCPLQIQRLQGRDVKGQPRQKRDIMLMHILPGSMLYPSPNGGRNDPYSM